MFVAIALIITFLLAGIVASLKFIKEEIEFRQWMKEMERSQEVRKDD
jgi:hypothetical protein|nr:MAG TPA: hypothetical protein [Caudoviricetes sp.]